MKRNAELGLPAAASERRNRGGAGFIPRLQGLSRRFQDGWIVTRQSPPPPTKSAVARATPCLLPLELEITPLDISASVLLQSDESTHANPRHAACRDALHRAFRPQPGPSGCR